MNSRKNLPSLTVEPLPALQALVFSPTLFHSASRSGGVCRVAGDAAPTLYGGDVSLGNCAPLNTGMESIVILGMMHWYYGLLNHKQQQISQSSREYVDESQFGFNS